MQSTVRQYLVTAGNTREPIDEVRDWGNIFTGNTGLEIARSLAATSDSEVLLLTSNRQHIEQLSYRQGVDARIQARAFTTHANLRSVLQDAMAERTYDAVFMTAAIADYTPVRGYRVLQRTINPDGSETWQVQNAQRGKIRSDHPELAILGQRTAKLVDMVRSPWNHRGLLFKFKLEVGISEAELLSIARKSRVASDADYLVANTLEMVRGSKPGAYIVSSTGEQWVARHELASRLAELAQGSGDQ